MELPGIVCVLRVARLFTGGRPARPQVALRHVPSGRFLGDDGAWTADARVATWIDDDDQARRLLEWLACEPVFELVPASALAASAA